MTTVPVDAVIFDVGGVLLTHTDASARAAWQRRLSLPDGELERLVWEAIGSRGAAQRAAIVTSIVGMTSLSEPDAAQLLEDFHAHWLPVEELLDVLVALRSSYKIGILGNIPASGRFAFEYVLGLHEVSDEMVLSAEVGLQKPDPAIYRLMASRLGVPPERCLLVDNLAENVEGARRVGMRAIHHVSVEGTLRQLRAELRIAV